MSRKFVRDTVGRFASTVAMEGKSARAAKNRADLKRRLRGKASGGKARSGSLRGRVSKVVITSQSRKFTDRYKRRLKKRG